MVEVSRRLGFAIRVLIDVVSNICFRLLYFNSRKGLPPVTNKILLLSATGKLSHPQSFSSLPHLKPKIHFAF